MHIMDKLIAGAKKLGLSLTERQLEQFEVYYKELVEWNSRLNLTSITGYEEVQINHFLDSLTLIPALDNLYYKNTRIIDIGTGAGFPGIPLKIISPDIRLSLLDSTGKKADFLKYITAKLGTRQVEIITARAEEAARREEYRERFDTVISRAMAPLATLSELCLPFCTVGGCFIAPKKGDIKQEIEDAEKAVKILGGRLREVKKIELDEFTDGRCLVVIDKVSLTPEKYPRRPGMPVKRPLP